MAPCPPDSPEHRHATRELEALDHAIRALASNEELGRVWNQLLALGESPCFEIGGSLNSLDDKAKPTSALSLKQFWDDGGKVWIQGYLDLGKQASVGPFLYTQPSFRSVLSRESTPNHRLGSLLCSEHDEACVQQTQAFRKRALARFELEYERRRLAHWYEAVRDDPDALVPFDVRECTARTTSTGRQRDLTEWLQCLEEHNERRLDFPLGGIAKPTRGWLVVSGRRGHYQFCDERRAYHLASGAAYSVGSCSDLQLGGAGGVDHRKTDRGRSIRKRRGHMPPLALQEAVWFLLLAPELQEVTEALGYPVPPGVVRASREQWLGGTGLSSMCQSSANTRLSWSYIVDGRELTTGTLTWPGCGWEDLDNNYAVELLDLAELQFVEGCPQRTPDRPRVNQQALSANALDSDAKSLERAASMLARAWQELLAQPCR